LSLAQKWTVYVIRYLIPGAECVILHSVQTMASLHLQQTFRASLESAQQLVRYARDKRNSFGDKKEKHELQLRNNGGTRQSDSTAISQPLRNTHCRQVRHASINNRAVVMPTSWPSSQQGNMTAAAAEAVAMTTQWKEQWLEWVDQRGWGHTGRWRTFSTTAQTLTITSVSTSSSSSSSSPSFHLFNAWQRLTHNKYEVYYRPGRQCAITVVSRAVSPEIFSGKFLKIYSHFYGNFQQNIRNNFIGNFRTLQSCTNLPNNCAFAYNDTFQRLLHYL